MAKYSKLFQIEVTHYPADGDDPAGFVAVNDELGLCIEVSTFDALLERVQPAAQELFDLNVLPTLREDVAASPPAFRLSHLLGDSGHGNDLLPKPGCFA